MICTARVGVRCAYPNLPLDTRMRNPTVWGPFCFDSPVPVRPCLERAPRRGVGRQGRRPSRLCQEGKCLRCPVTGCALEVCPSGTRPFGCLSFASFFGHAKKGARARSRRNARTHCIRTAAQRLDATLAKLAFAKQHPIRQIGGRERLCQATQNPLRQPRPIDIAPGTPPRPGPATGHPVRTTPPPHPANSRRDTWPDDATSRHSAVVQNAASRPTPGYRAPDSGCPGGIRNRASRRDATAWPRRGRA